MSRLHRIGWMIAAVGVACGGTPLQAAPLSPAEQKILNAQLTVQQFPNRCEPYNDLALSLALRARETGDTAYYEQAEETLRRSFSLAPDNFEGRKVRVWLLLGKHLFLSALKAAQALERQHPHDPQVLAFLVDANIELGSYRQAERTAQRLLDLYPGSVAGLTRAAYLRELFGDIEGAILLMEDAYARMPMAEMENRAWILTHQAHLKLTAGQVTQAEDLLLEALRLFPSYHYALASLAEVRTAQGRFADAVELYHLRFLAAPHPENLYALAKALKRAGRREESDRLWKLFERTARAEMADEDNANRELIFYYIEEGQNPKEALRIALREKARRRDVFTLDACAWALHANGEYEKAHREITRALSWGVQDPKLLSHAEAIALKREEISLLNGA